MFFEFGLIGTTASGKSDLAIKLAKTLNAVILSLDSLCLYKEINIASAKPSQEELNNVKHFGINLVSVDEEFCVGDFFKEYKKARIYAKQNDIPLIITGGSGFYLSALLSGLSPKIPKLEEIKNYDEIWEKAKKIDPKFSSKFSKNDKFRLQKWFEIYEFSKEIPSVWLEKNTDPAIIKELLILQIDLDKEKNIQRIAKRTNLMIKNGLLDEAKELFSKFDSSLKPLKSIGLKECKSYFDGELGEINSKEALKNLEDLICIHTNQLAKKQRTFNRSKFDSVLLNFDNAKKEALEILENKFKISSVHADLK